VSESSETSVSPTAGVEEERFDGLLKELVQRAELTEIRYTKWHAELLVEEPGDVGEIEVKITHSLRVRGTTFDTKFEVDVPVLSEDEKDLARIEMAIVASFTLEGGEPPERKLVSEFIRRVAFFVVMPFIRESLHSLSTRLGLEPITIGLLQQGSAMPVQAWVKRRQGGNPSQGSEDR
jgi:hypothetical protein